MAKHAITAGDDPVDQVLADAIERRVRVRWPSELDAMLIALLARIDAEDPEPPPPPPAPVRCKRCRNDDGLIWLTSTTFVPCDHADPDAAYDLDANGTPSYLREATG